LFFRRALHAGPEQQLALLDPPLKHKIACRSQIILFIIDPAGPARVTRSLSQPLIRNTPLLYTVIRDAVNELYAPGAHAPVSEREIFPDDSPRS